MRALAFSRALPSHTSTLLPSAKYSSRKFLAKCQGWYVHPSASAISLLRNQRSRIAISKVSDRLKLFRTCDLQSPEGPKIGRSAARASMAFIVNGGNSPSTSSTRNSRKRSPGRRSCIYGTNTAESSWDVGGYGAITGG